MRFWLLIFSALLNVLPLATQASTPVKARKCAAAAARSAVTEIEGNTAKYDWIRETSPESENRLNVWINQQVGRVNTSLKDSKNLPAFNAFLRAFFNRETDLDIVDVPLGELAIVDRGVGINKPVDPEIRKEAGTDRTKREELRQQRLLETRKSVDVVLRVKDEKTGQTSEKVLVSSFDFKRNNSTVPTALNANPSGDLAAVAFSHHGSLDRYRIIVFDIASGKKIADIENTSSEDVTWLTDNRFQYRKGAPPKPTVDVQIENGKVTQTELKSPSLRWQASAERKWVFAGNDKFTTFVKTQGHGWAMQNLPIGKVTNVFEASTGDLWILSKSGNGFGEVSRIGNLRKALADDKPEFFLESIIDESNYVTSQIKEINSGILVRSYRGQEQKFAVLDLEGNPINEMSLPGCCTGNVTAYDVKSQEFTLTLQSPIVETATWKYNAKSSEWSIKTADGKWKSADPKTEMLTRDSIAFIVEYENYKSKDGTTIPMRLTRRKDLKQDGKNPFFLYGYGGFGLNGGLFPSHSRTMFEFIKQGAIHAAPALRGGLEFGPPWHDAGRDKNKQNSVDDFIGAAQFAVDQKWTNPKLVAAQGASHGGLVVGAAITQRPDLFGLAIPQFGAHDFSRKGDLDPEMVPYQTYEYGDLAADPAAIARAAKLSPFLNAKPQNYPLTLVTTGRKDSRVNPRHSDLFAARLMDNQRGEQPIYLFELKNAGHWQGSQGLQDQIAIRHLAVYWTVIFDYFGMKAPLSNAPKAK